MNYAALLFTVQENLLAQKIYLQFKFLCATLLHIGSQTTTKEKHHVQILGNHHGLYRYRCMRWRRNFASRRRCASANCSPGHYASTSSRRDRSSSLHHPTKLGW